MARGEQGLAQKPNWNSNKARVYEQAQGGLATALGGDQVFLDFVAGDRTEQPMRLVFQLFEQLPLAFANFHAMCTHSHTGLGEAGKAPLTYRKSSVHRVVKGCYLEAGVSPLKMTPPIALELLTACHRAVHAGHHTWRRPRW